MEIREKIISKYAISIHFNDISMGFFVNDQYSESYINIQGRLQELPTYHQEIISKLNDLINREDTNLDRKLTKENFEQLGHDDLAYAWGMYESYMYSTKYFTTNDFFGSKFLFNTEDVLNCLIEYWNFLVKWQNKDLLIIKLEPVFNYFQKFGDNNKLIYYYSEIDNINYRITPIDFKYKSYEQFISKIQWPAFEKRELINIY